MRIYKTAKGAVIRNRDDFYVKEVQNWDSFINRKGLYKALLNDIVGIDPVRDTSLIDSPLAPIGNQEIWASGVTYMRSRDARMEESKKSGGYTFYDKVYDAERPELFSRRLPAELLALEKLCTSEKILSGMFQNLS